MPRATPPELRAWQVEFLDRVARSKLAREVVFGGGAALAAVHLHHRLSEDLDFFMMRETEPADLAGIARATKRAGISVDQRVLGPRRSLVLRRANREIGRVDLSYYPYDPVGREGRWRGLRVDSLVDATVNKVQAVLTRFQPRDFVDLYFLLREGPERDLEQLLDLVRAKFDVGADRLALAERLVLCHDIVELPRMLRALDRAKLVAYFDEQARALVHKG